MNIINLIHQKREDEKFASEEEFIKNFEEMYCEKVIEGIGEFIGEIKKMGKSVTKESFNEYVKANPTWLKNVPFACFEEIQKRMDNFNTERRVLNEKSLELKGNQQLKESEKQISLLRSELKRECRPFTDKALVYRMLNDIVEPSCEKVSFKEYDYLLLRGCNEKTPMHALLKHNLMMYKRIKARTIERDGFDEGIDRITYLMALQKKLGKIPVSSERAIKILRETPIEDVRMGIGDVLRRLQHEQVRELRAELGVDNLIDLYNEKGRIYYNADRREAKTRNFINTCNAKRFFLGYSVENGEFIENKAKKESLMSVDKKQEVTTEEARKEAREAKKGLLRGMIKNYKGAIHKIILSREESDKDSAALRSAYDLYWMNLALSRDIAYSKEIANNNLYNTVVFNNSNRESYYSSPYEIVENTFKALPILFTPKKTNAERLLVESSDRLSEVVRIETCGIKGFPQGKPLPTYRDVVRKVEAIREQRKKQKIEDKSKSVQNTSRPVIERTAGKRYKNKYEVQIAEPGKVVSNQKQRNNEIRKVPSKVRNAVEATRKAPKKSVDNSMGEIE